MMEECLCFPYESDESSENYSIKDINEIMCRIVDDDSKRIFSNRIMLSITLDQFYMKELILCTDAGKQFYEKMLEYKGIYVYGAGIRGDRIVRIFQDICWRGYIDKNRKGKLNGFKIVNLGDVCVDDEIGILISNYQGYEKIKEDLLDAGCNEDNIILLSEYENLLKINQYFEKRCLPSDELLQEVFIDGGAYDGSNSLDFSRKFHPTEIIAFEPDEKSYACSTENLLKVPNSVVIKKGISDRNGFVGFESGGGEISRINTQSDNGVNNFIEVK